MHLKILYKYANTNLDRIFLIESKIIFLLPQIHSENFPHLWFFLFQSRL